MGYHYAHKNDIMRSKEMPNRGFFNELGGGEDVGIVAQIRPSKVLQKYTIKREL